MANTTKMPTLPTDKMIRAAQHGCGLTPIEAVLIYQTMVTAFEDDDDTVIYNGLMENQKQKAILAAETVDLRAGNAVRRALG